MKKTEYVDRVAIREKVCTGCTMLVDGVCRDADPCEKLIAGFLEEPSADVVPAHPKERERNDPLTLNELRSSVKFGYPVYLVGMEDGDGFVFIHHVDSLSVRYSRIGDHPEVEYCFRTKSYGVRVWAYLQKPEESCNG